MEAKYYTPTIEEFHVGFEYETNYLSKDWEKRTVKIDDAAWFFDTYYKDATSLEFRVKLLDREDIESLGWNPDKISEFIKGKHSLNICLNTIHIYVPGDYDGEEPHFNGKIKNKSELKKLMVQLGIA